MSGHSRHLSASPRNSAVRLKYILVQGVSKKGEGEMAQNKKVEENKGCLIIRPTTDI